MFWMSGIEVKQCYVNEYLKTGSPGRKKRKHKETNPNQKQSTQFTAFANCCDIKIPTMANFKLLSINLTEP